MHASLLYMSYQIVYHVPVIPRTMVSHTQQIACESSQHAQLPSCKAGQSGLTLHCLMCSSQWG